MDNIHIEDSYKIWSIKKMRQIIDSHVYHPSIMNRTYFGLYIEWYLHNIGYYITLPLFFIPSIKKINYRFKHVDLEGHYSG